MWPTDEGGGRAGGRPVPESDQPRFAGLPTFMRLPYAGAPDGFKAVVLGIPWDGGTTFRPGARFGPSAVRAASATLYAYHPVHRRDVFEGRPTADLGDVAVVPGDVGRTLAAVEAMEGRIARAGAFPLALGGDHSVTLGELRALARRHGPLAVIQLDSHTDLWEAFWGVGLTHGTFLRRALEEGLVDPSHSALVGLRGSVDRAVEADFAARAGLLSVTAEELLERPVAATADAIRARVGDRPTFLTFDVDVLDPAYAPGTGTPEVGGPSTGQVLALLRRLRGVRLVGADVVEVAPAYDHAEITALAAATVAFELLALAAWAMDSETR